MWRPEVNTGVSAAPSVDALGLNRGQPWSQRCPPSVDALGLNWGHQVALHCRAICHPRVSHCYGIKHGHLPSLFTGWQGDFSRRINRQMRDKGYCMTPQCLEVTLWDTVGSIAPSRPMNIHSHRVSDHWAAIRFGAAHATYYSIAHQKITENIHVGCIHFILQLHLSMVMKCFSFYNVEICLYVIHTSRSNAIDRWVMSEVCWVEAVTRNW